MGTAYADVRRRHAERFGRLDEPPTLKEPRSPMKRLAEGEISEEEYLQADALLRDSERTRERLKR